MRGSLACCEEACPIGITFERPSSGMDEILQQLAVLWGVLSIPSGVGFRVGNLEGGNVSPVDEWLQSSRLRSGFYSEARIK